MLNNLWHKHNRILNSSGNEQAAATTWNSIDEAHKHSVKWKNSKHKKMHKIHIKSKNQAKAHLCHDITV